MVAQTTIPKELFSFKEASALGYGGVTTLRRHASEGRLRTVRIGGSIKVTRGDLDAFVARSTTTLTTLDDDLEAAIRELVASAPRLSPAQCARISAIFAGGASA